MYLLLLLLLRALLNLFNLLQFLQRLSFPRFDLVLFLLLGFQIYVVSHRFGHQFFRRLLWRFRAIAIATRFTTVIIIGRLCTDATFRRRRRRRRRRIHRRFLPLRFFLPLFSLHVLRHSPSFLVLLLPDVHDVLSIRWLHRTRR